MSTMILSRINQTLLVAIFGSLLRVLGLAVIAVIMALVIQSKFDSLRELNADQGPTFVSAADRTKQLECLSRNIYFEAGGEPFEGKVAVAQVTMNRVESGRFGDGVCGVIYKKDNILGNIVCQFSWTCTNSNKVAPINWSRYKESEEVAKKVLFENFRLPSLSTAMYYHADYVNPKWGKPKVAQIGRHIFYKE